MKTGHLVFAGLLTALAALLFVALPALSQPKPPAVGCKANHAGNHWDYDLKNNSAKAIPAGFKLEIIPKNNPPIPRKIHVLSAPFAPGATMLVPGPLIGDEPGGCKVRVQNKKRNPKKIRQQ